MSDNSNKKDKTSDINKVEEPTVAYNSEKNAKPELNSVLNQMLEIGLKQIQRGETKPHEQVMAEMKLKYNFK